MAWTTAELDIDAPCPVRPLLAGAETFQCAAPGGDMGAIGWLRGPEGARLMRGPDRPCMDCPMARRGRGICTLQVDVRKQGIRAHIAGDEDAIHCFATRLRTRFATRLRPGSDAAPPRVVDLRLSAKQQEALRAAHRLGRYRVAGAGGTDELAKEMGVSRSTAHEHLQKALARVVAEVAG